MVSAYEFFENDCTVTIDGKEMTFISYEDYLDYIGEQLRKSNRQSRPLQNVVRLSVSGFLLREL